MTESTPPISIDAAQPAAEHLSAPASTNTWAPEEFARLQQIYDAFQPIWLTPTITLGVWKSTDRDILVEYLNDIRIHAYLLGPPFPYKIEHADFWLGSRYERMTDKGTPLDFCFRDMARGGRAIGSVAVSKGSDECLKGDDAGYWLAPEYHGQGLMSKALRMMLHRVSMVEVGKRKFNAHAFIGNYASRRTLEKIGFKMQEDIHETATKNNEEIQMWTLRLYVTDEDVENWEQVPEATPLPSLVQ